MEIVVHNVKMQKKDEITLLRPLTDIHYGHPGHDEAFFDESIKYINETPNCLWIGLGDYVENNTVTGRGAKTFDEEMPLAKSRKQQSILPTQEIRKFREKIRPIVPKGVGLAIGNHEDRTINHDMFKLLFTEPLGMRYLGDRAYVILKFWYHGNLINTYKLIATHSRFGGQYGGTVQMAAMRAMNRYEGIDAVLYGHTHYTQAEKQFRKFIDTSSNPPQIVLRKYYLVNCGCFVHEEVEGYDNYADKKFNGGIREPGTVTLDFDPYHGKFHAHA